MTNQKFKQYLTAIGFSETEISENLKDNVFTYTLPNTSFPCVKYIFTTNVDDIFYYHKALWNKNTDTVFIAVRDDHTYIINAREKPDKHNVLKQNTCIKTFNYGVNTTGYESIDAEIISKTAIDSSYFFDFVSKNQKRGQEVDKDLLLNLLALRNDLLEDGNEKIINLLILRCLFIKYLEDRGIFENGFLINILKSNDSDKLIKAFDEIRKINSDVFKFDIFQISDIKQNYLINIARFFESDYRSGQGTLFPYQFDQIPIQLISHVYEAFLKSDTRKGRGIYYTPSFLVDFMLSNTLINHASNNQNIRVLDPAVGSGAFLVESFRIIKDAQGANISFEAKKKILENQLFGIDVDQDALQIAAFSLYLVLLETESPDFIRHEIQVAHPILPSLIGKTLRLANTITDYVFDGEFFDFVVSNPPWGSIPNTDDTTCKAERIAIDNKSGHYPEYVDVADYERSQAFLMRVTRWSNRNTTFAMVVKNSIFLNDNTKNFRKAFLRSYSVQSFFELSHYNRILFKKREIGEIRGEKIEVGASEPCVAIIFKNVVEKNNTLMYVSPRLTEFADHFNIIHYTDREKIFIAQQDLISKDNLWRILVNSDLDGFDLIENTLKPQSELEVEARAGFQPKKGMISLGEPVWKELIEPTDFVQFQLKKVPTLFNWNQKLHRRRDESIYNGQRIIVPVRPLKPDNITLRGLYLESEYVYKHNILCIKLKHKDNYITNYLPYLAVINSQLIGFLFYQLSAQWGKGEGKRDTLRNTDIEKLPIKHISGKIEKQLTEVVNRIISHNDIKQDLFFNFTSEDNSSKQALLNRLNELVFDLYELTEYEKSLIREFYEIETERADSKKNKVNQLDIKHYINTFEEVFSLILDNQSTLSCKYYISKNIGAIVSISIVNNFSNEKILEDTNLQILHFVKNKQLSAADAFNVLNEGKVKIYTKDRLYIIKSNYLRDWTTRQAAKDAKEEIELFVRNLPHKKWIHKLTS